MTVQLPDGIPPWVADLVIGHIPVGDPEAMRRCADYLSAAADNLARRSRELDQFTLDTVRASMDSETSAALEELLTRNAADMRAVSEGLDTLARKIYEAANALEFQQYLAVGIAIALTVQLTASLVMFAAGGSVIGLAQRLAAKEAVVLGWRNMLTWMAQILARWIVRFPRLSMTLGAAALGMGIGGGVNYGAQRLQVAEGHRDKIAWGEVGVAVLAGGVGGVVGASAGRAAAAAVTRRGLNTASRAARMRRQVLATLAAGAFGGISGGLAGGIAAWAVTGGQLRGRDLMNMAATGFGSGLVTAVSSSLHAARAAGRAAPPTTDTAITGVPARGPRPVGRLATATIPDGPLRPVTATGDGHAPPPRDLSSTDMARGQEVPRDLAGGVDEVFRTIDIDPAAFPDGPARNAADAFIAEQRGTTRPAGPATEANTGTAPKDPGTQPATSTTNRSPATATGPTPATAHPTPTPAPGTAHPPAGGVSAPEARPVRVTAPVAATPDSAPPRISLDSSNTPSRPVAAAPEGIGDGSAMRPAISAPDAPAGPVGDAGPPGPAPDVSTYAAPDGGGDTNPPPGSTDSPPPSYGDGAWNGPAAPESYTPGEMYCAPEAVADTYQKTGYSGVDPSALPTTAAARGVEVVNYVKSLGGDMRPGGWDTPRALVEDIRTGADSRHVAAAIQMKHGAHAFTVTKTEAGHTIIHERVGNIVRDISSQGWIREHPVDGTGRRIGPDRVTHDPDALGTWLTGLPEVVITNGVEFIDGRPVLPLNGAEPGGPDGLRPGLDVPWDPLGNLPEGATALLERDAAPPPDPEAAPLNPATEAAFADLARMFDRPSAPVSADLGPVTAPEAAANPATQPAHRATEPRANQPADKSAGPVAETTPNRLTASADRFAGPIADEPSTGRAAQPPNRSAEPPAVTGSRDDAGSAAAPAPHPDSGSPETATTTPKSAVSADPTPGVRAPAATSPADTPATATRGAAMGTTGFDEQPPEPEEFRPRPPGPLVTMPRPSLIPDPGEYGTTYPMELPPEYERTQGDYIQIPGVPHTEDDDTNRETVLPRELSESRPRIPAERLRFQPYDPDQETPGESDPHAEPPATPWATPPQRFSAAPPAHLPATPATAPTDTSPLPGHYAKRPDDTTPGAPTDPSRRPSLNPHSLDHAPPLSGIPDHTTGPAAPPAPPPGKPAKTARPVPWAQAGTGDPAPGKKRREPALEQQNVPATSPPPSHRQADDERAYDLDPASNPVSAAVVDPTAAPAFDRMEAAYFLPVFEDAIEVQSAAIEAIVANPGPWTPENTLRPFIDSGRLLGAVKPLFSEKAAVDRDTATAQLEPRIAELKAAHTSRVLTDPGLAAIFAYLHEHRDDFELSERDRGFLERKHQAFVDAGAYLASDQDRRALAALDREVSELQTVYKDNQENAAKDFVLRVSDAEKLDGLTPEQIAGARDRAGAAGGYALPKPNGASSIWHPYLPYLKDPELSRELYEKVAGLAVGGAHDNSANVLRQVRALAVRARMTGHENYADYVLSGGIFDSVRTVGNILDQIAPAAATAARVELPLLAAAIGEDAVRPSNRSRAVETLITQRVGLDSQRMREFFELDCILVDGVFGIAGDLFGLTISEVTAAEKPPVWHEDVRVFAVADETGNHLTDFYFDPYSRAGKNGGEWTDPIRLRDTPGGRPPLVGVHLNLEKPIAGMPTLLAPNEVSTLFHEFGHALHFLMSEGPYEPAERHLVFGWIEFVAKVFQQLWNHPRVLPRFAVHHETGRPMPPEDLAKLDKWLSAYRGTTTVFRLTGAYIDKAWSSLTPEQIPRVPAGAEARTVVARFEQDVLAEAGVHLPEIGNLYPSQWFRHLFGQMGGFGTYFGQYSAYLLSDVLAHIVFGRHIDPAVARHGISRETGNILRELIFRTEETDLAGAVRRLVGSNPSVGQFLAAEGLLWANALVKLDAMADPEWLTTPALRPPGTDLVAWWNTELTAHERAAMIQAFPAEVLAMGIDHTQETEHTATERLRTPLPYAVAAPPVRAPAETTPTPPDATPRDAASGTKNSADTPWSGSSDHSTTAAAQDSTTSSVEEPADTAPRPSPWQRTAAAGSTPHNEDRAAGASRRQHHRRAPVPRPPTEPLATNLSRNGPLDPAVPAPAILPGLKQRHVPPGAVWFASGPGDDQPNAFDGSNSQERAARAAPAVPENTTTGEHAAGPPEQAAGSGSFPIDLETADVAALRRAMEQGHTDSVAVVGAYLRRIETLDRSGPLLNAIRAVNPDAVRDAARLDAERGAGQVRGPLHGIPVLVKDNIDVAGMPTTAGALALRDSYPDRDSFLVARLREAGAVILGKANLGELGNFVTDSMPSGYSALGGRVLNPYGTELDPMGSSTGSAVAAAAGLAAITVGTETAGSIICPAVFNSLVGVKPTVGLVSRTGIVPISVTQDTAGPLARTVSDAAALLTALSGPDPDDPATARGATFAGTDYTAMLSTEALRGRRLGVAITAPDAVYGVAEDSTLFAQLAEAHTVLREQGAELVPVSVVPPGGERIPLYEFKPALESYLARLPADAPIKTLADLIRFNIDHAGDGAIEYGQEVLMKAEAIDLGDPATYRKYRDGLDRQLATYRAVIDTALIANRLDAIVFPHSNAWQVAPKAGYPAVSLPIGYDPATAQPHGMTLVGTAFSEASLLAMAYAYEQAAPVRRPPSELNPAVARALLGRPH